MELVVRATVVYWFLWLVVRGTGKRSLSQISPLELVMTVVLGDFVQQGVTQEDMSTTGAVIVVSTFACWMLFGDVLLRRSKGAERVLEGQAIVVVRDGEVLRDNLAHERLTMDDLLEEAREQGYGDVADVRLGVLEPDGRFSFVPKANVEH